jgi:peptidoglycan hydrolase CwlO-like protein
MTTFSELSKRTAATLIAAFIMGVFGLAGTAIFATTVGSKADEKEFDRYRYTVDFTLNNHKECIENIKSEQLNLRKDLENLTKSNSTINENFKLIMYRLDQIDKKLDRK